MQPERTARMNRVQAAEMMKRVWRKPDAYASEQHMAKAVGRPMSKNVSAHVRVLQKLAEITFNKGRIHDHAVARSVGRSEA